MATNLLSIVVKRTNYLFTSVKSSCLDVFFYLNNLGIEYEN